MFLPICAFLGQLPRRTLLKLMPSVLVLVQKQSACARLHKQCANKAKRVCQCLVLSWAEQIAAKLPANRAQRDQECLGMWALMCGRPQPLSADRGSSKDIPMRFLQPRVVVAAARGASPPCSPSSCTSTSCVWSVPSRRLQHSRFPPSPNTISGQVNLRLQGVQFGDCKPRLDGPNCNQNWQLPVSSFATREQN